VNRKGTDSTSELFSNWNVDLLLKACQAKNVTLTFTIHKCSVFTEFPPLDPTSKPIAGSSESVVSLMWEKQFRLIIGLCGEGRIASPPAKAPTLTA
jgi:hypothetical protein